MEKVADTPEIRAKIRQILREHPGLRKREIGGYLKIYHIRIITLLHQMEADGEIYRKLFNDPANMEFYDQYFVKEG